MYISCCGFAGVHQGYGLHYIKPSVAPAGVEYERIQ